MGGFIAEDTDWKYVFVFVAALSGIAGAVGIPFLRETYSPYIRLQLSKTMSPEEAMKRHPHLELAHGKGSGFVFPTAMLSVNGLDDPHL